MHICKNHLFVTGPSVCNFLRSCSGRQLNGKQVNFTFNSLNPPKVLPKSAVDPDTYRDWCRVNWGTSEDAKNTSIEFKNKQLTVGFETINTPADQWVYNVSRLYPNLTFCLTYQSDLITGELICSGGYVIKEE